MSQYLLESTLGDLMSPDKLAALNEHYIQNKPFPHIVLDGVFNSAALREAAHRFPTPHSLRWWEYCNILERKLALDDTRDLHDSLRFLINELMEKRFVQFLEKLTGIQGLIVDHTLNGGGLHQIVNGGKLDIHADYNYHPITRLDRRLNVLLYLNEGWKDEWGGALELWDSGMTRCEKSIMPYFNRLVVFSTTDQSLHGHPDPLNCPALESRKSIALYYYTNGRPEHERSEPHSTLFKKRPGDPNDPQHEELRLRRAIRRISQ